MKCRGCGTKIPDSYEKFLCSDCMSLAFNDKICPVCGGRIKRSNKPVCKECGVKWRVPPSGRNVNPRCRHPGCNMRQEDGSYYCHIHAKERIDNAPNLYKIYLILCGTRTFDDYDLLCEKVGFYLSRRALRNVTVLSGGCRGADKAGERWARENSVPILEFPAEWDKHGKSAGYIRNKQMAEKGTHLIAFWDGKSKGTEMMIRLAREHGLKVRVVRYDKGEW